MFNHALLIHAQPVAPAGMRMETAELVALIEIGVGFHRHIGLIILRIVRCAEQADAQGVVVKMLFFPVDVPIL